MQPYPRAPELFWPGHLHGTGCLSARAMETWFPTVVWPFCLGPGCAWARVSVTPPTLAGVLGGCVWVRVVVSPLHSRLVFLVFAVGVGFWLAPHHSWLLYSGACVVVCALCLYPAVPGSGVRCWCLCLGSGFGCALPLLAEVLGCVCVRVRVPPGPLPLLAGGAVRVCVLGLGLQPRPATPGLGVGTCVWLYARLACTPPLLAGVCGVGVCAWARVSAVSRHSWLGRWGVCVFLRVPRFHPAIPGGVVCVCVGFGFVCSPVWLAVRC